MSANVIPVPDIEDHIQNIRQISDNLSVLSRGLASISPEAENAVGIMSALLKDEADAMISLLYSEELSDRKEP